MKLFFVTWLEDNQGKTLNKMGVRHRLFSYYFLKDAPKGFLGKYIKEACRERKERRKHGSSGRRNKENSNSR